jgi:hypothetical protein
MRIKTLFSALSTICLLILLSISLGYFKDPECHTLVLTNRIMTVEQYLILFMVYFPSFDFLQSLQHLIEPLSALVEESFMPEEAKEERDWDYVDVTVIVVLVACELLWVYGYCYWS